MPVYEQGYRHFAGSRAARLLRFAPITANGVRLALRSKLFTFAVVLPSQIAMIVGAVIAYVVFQQAPQVMSGPAGAMIPMRFDMEELQRRVGPPLYWGILMVQSRLWLPAVGALLAGRLVAGDAQANALEVYFSRPITRFDYAAGKFLTAFGFFLYVTLLPPIGAWGAACLLAPDTAYMKSTLGMAWGIAVNALLVSGVAAFLLLGVSSVSKKPRFAAALWIGVLVFSAVASQILIHSVRRPGGYLVSILFHCQRLGYTLVSPDLEGQLTQRGIALPPSEHSVVILAGIVVVSAVVFVKRLHAVEIVK